MQEPSVINAPGASFIELQSVDSTNNYARELIRAHSLPERQANSLHGTAVFAHEQVSGKGQRGRIWTSEKDQNIALSVILQPSPLGLQDQFQLNVAVALAALDLFSEYAGGGTSIKWPNDLYWQDRKAGGILIESIVSSGLPPSSAWEWAIAGIGININQTSFAPFLRNPISLKLITNTDYKIVSLARELAGFIRNRFSQIRNGEFAALFARYNDHLYKKNEPVKLKKDNRSFEAVIKGVSPAGRLIVQHAFEEEFDFGEVEWVI